MAVIYTTAAIVKKRLKNITMGPNTLLDADIEENINQAEGIINAVMQKSGLAGGDFTFSATKHGVIRAAATALAAFFCLTYDIEAFGTSSAASISADLLWADADRNLAILSSPRVIYYLVNA